jgi:hypothetical protein
MGTHGCWGRVSMHPAVHIVLNAPNDPLAQNPTYICTFRVLDA